MYKRRFENIFRVAKKVTSSIDVGDILEIVRDQAKITIPHAKEACLLMFDPEALRYTRPLHCAVYKNRINCQLCKRGRATIKGALSQPRLFPCASDQSGNLLSTAAHSDDLICEIALPIYDGEQLLAVLDVIAKEGRGFDTNDIRLLKDLAELAANAIVNTRKHWMVAQEKLNLDSILTHLRPFVPKTVQQIVEKNPITPFLEKRDMDVSILFLDVGGYTKISERLTQEKINFIIEKYFSSFLDIIYANQGDINETAGDGLMAIFQGTGGKMLSMPPGPPSISTHGRLKSEKSWRDDLKPIEVNMGINSGIASVGMTKFRGAAGTRMTYTASGAVTNLASRIASAAAGGDILVGPETAGRIRDEIIFFDRGLMNFKNVNEEVQVYSLIRPKQI